MRASHSKGNSGRFRPTCDDANFFGKPMQVGYKKLARLVTMFIFKLNLCKVEIKNFVRKRKFKPPHGVNKK